MTSLSPPSESDGKLQVSLDVPKADAPALREWLKQEPALRRHIKRESTPGRPGTMGSWSDLVVVLASSQVAIELVRSLQTWLSQRRSDVSVSIVAADGSKIDVSVSRATDPEQIINLARAALPGAENTPPRQG